MSICDKNWIYNCTVKCNKVTCKMLVTFTEWSVPLLLDPRPLSKFPGRDAPPFQHKPPLQSPINIRTSHTIPVTLPPLRFNNLISGDVLLQVKNTGSTGNRVTSKWTLQSVLIISKGFNLSFYYVCNMKTVSDPWIPNNICTHVLNEWFYKHIHLGLLVCCVFAILNSEPVNVMVNSILKLWNLTKIPFN